MKLLILLLAISRLSDCSHPLLYPVPVQYHGVTVGITPYSAPVNSHSQYHAQDIHGHYSYGYATDLSAQDEVRTTDGVTRGGYSYIDANGILQTVQYVSDPVHGFRVAATNLPRDLPEVAAARAQHLAQFEYIKAEHAAIAASRGDLPAVISPVPAPGAFIVPVRAAAIVAPIPPAHVEVPVAFTPPVVAISSQYQAQDGHGQYSYGYADPNSAKSETKTADGVTRGGYSYIDANGVLQTVQYVSDPVNGFRVAATNLPQAPSVTLIGPKVTATVVGPKDNNAAGVAVPAVSAIDSIAVEQRPVLAQADIVQNANVPLVNPVGPGPYIHPNPNHEPVAVLANPGLTPPFQPSLGPQYVDVPNPPQYASAHIPSQYVPVQAPVPSIHSHAVLHNQQPPYAASPGLENTQYYTEQPPQYATSYPIPQPDGGVVIGLNHPSQILRAPEYQPTSDNGGQILGNPNLGPIAQYAPEQRGQIYDSSNIQIPHDHQALIADPRNQIYAAEPRAQILAADPRGQLLAADSRGQLLVEDPRGQNLAGDPRGQLLPDQRGQLLVADPRAQLLAENQRDEGPNGHILNADPRGQILHIRGQYLADANLQGLGDPNVQQRYPITLNSHELPPDYRENYQLPGPINADTINNGPINQQILNQDNGPARLALFAPDAAQQVQQVQVQGRQGDGISQVGGPGLEQQPFIVRVAEHESGDANSNVDDGRDEGRATGVTPPSGYYTQNIQY